MTTPFAHLCLQNHPANGFVVEASCVSYDSSARAEAD